MLFVINSMLAVINPDSDIKHDLAVRAKTDLHEVVTPAAVALCYVWIKLWVPFVNKNGEQQEVSDEASSTSGLTEESQDSNKGRKRRGRMIDNPSYLKPTSKAMYTRVKKQVQKNRDAGDQKNKWNCWWKQKMQQVVEDADALHPRTGGTKRKRNSEKQLPLLPSGAELFAEV